jgi:hypothetical protein
MTEFDRAEGDAVEWPAGVPPLSEEQLATLRRFEERFEERQRRYAEAVRYDADGRERYDAAQLFATIQNIIRTAHMDARTEQVAGRSLFDAEERALDDDPRHGHLAGLLVGGITRGRGDLNALAAADAVLNGSADDPLRERVREAVRRVADYEIDSTQFAKKMKGVLPQRAPAVPPPPPNALPLSEAQKTFEHMLAAAGVALTARPTVGDVWRAFIEFAAQPFAVATPLYIDNDMCFVEWGVRESDHEAGFFFDLVRQWSLNDADDGSYDHMEQLHMTLLLAAKEAELVSLGADSIWAGEAVAEWVRNVEAHAAFVAVCKLPIAGHQLFHEEV